MSEACIRIDPLTGAHILKEATMPENQMPTTLEELRAFVRAEVRKVLAEDVRRIGYYPPRMETKVSAPSSSTPLPAWARHEEGAAH